MSPEASPDSGQRSGPTEAEFERTPEAEAGRALVVHRLQRFSAEQQRAFWEAVSRCFASQPRPKTDGQSGRPGSL